LLVYAGSSLTGKYLGEAMLQFFRHVRTRRPDACLLLLMPRLDEARTMLSLNEDLVSSCILRSVAPEEVPALLGVADLGLCLIRPTYSMQAASAIKLGEYLLCGVPVLATAGVGESEAILGPEIGLCLPDTGDRAIAGAAKWFVEDILPKRQVLRDRCRSAGLAHYSLDNAVSELREALIAAIQRAHGERPS
jgi:glycosyltransferase involved in cell wall biosynthesis